MSCRVLNLLLTHQSAAKVRKMLDWWRRYVPVENLLLVCTGRKEDFSEIGHGLKLYLTDPRLQTQDHQRELQSYTKVFQHAATFLQSEQGRGFTHIHFAEYDQVPLVADLNERQVQAMEREHADVLGFRVTRTDGTNDPLTLYHQREERFGAHWAGMSRRGDPRAVLSMFGCGSCWTREAFLLTAAEPEPFPMYLEIYLPTRAHHLGCRVRNHDEQAEFVAGLRDRTGEIETARAAGGWSLHPVKSLW